MVSVGKEIRGNRQEKRTKDIHRRGAEGKKKRI